jgi:hypothetical protein
MSRLKRNKHAEVIEHKQITFGMLKIVKDPNSDEFEDIKKLSANDGFRCIINNNLYIWNLQLDVEDINQYLNNRIETSGLRVILSYNECKLDGMENMSVKEIVNNIKLYPTVFTGDYFYYIKNTNDSNNYKIDENKWYSLNKLINIVT